MGICWCRQEDDRDDMFPDGPRISAHQLAILAEDINLEECLLKVVDTVVINRLVAEMLRLIGSFVDNDRETPLSLVKLHLVADTEEGWIQVICSMINVIPLDHVFGPSAITILLDDCPLPSKDSLRKMVLYYDLSSCRARARTIRPSMERNICAVLGCLADKLAGPITNALFTEDTLDYLVTILVVGRDPDVMLFAMIALENFSLSSEFKKRIMKRLECEIVNPLLVLERYAEMEDCKWRQVGFFANWALDNRFVIEGRKLSYEVVDMSNIHVIMDVRNVSEYLKLSPDGLEVRCDTFSFESIRCMFQVEEGCWYYEVTIITPGVMQIGWATKNGRVFNKNGFGIGDDLFSLAYDGCRRLIWYKANPKPYNDIPKWRAGDILGCLIDIRRQEMIFSLNGVRGRAVRDFFETSRYGFFAAASLMAYQQCRFNFGNVPFAYPPTDRKFQCFNDFADLSDDEKKVIPKRLFWKELSGFNSSADSCTVCFDRTASCVLQPCGHGGFCTYCTMQVRECPLCRTGIFDVIRTYPAEPTKQ